LGTLTGKESGRRRPGLIYCRKEAETDPYEMSEVLLADPEESKNGPFRPLSGAIA
jgi:hypothetical protein